MRLKPPGLVADSLDQIEYVFILAGLEDHLHVLGVARLIEAKPRRRGMLLRAVYSDPLAQGGFAGLNVEQLVQQQRSTDISCAFKLVSNFKYL